MPPRNLGNRNPGSERLGDDPPLLLHRPAPAASYPGANVHPPARELRVAYSVAHMCETFPPNQQEDCNIPRASIKVGWENRLQYRGLRASFSFAADFLVTLELTVLDTLLGALCELLHTR